MFESADLGQELDKADYDVLVPGLRADLLDLQYRVLEQAHFPVVILINGVDGAGKGETVNVLNEWMDPRHILTHAFGARGEEEAMRPFMWRYWRALPPRGRIGILFGNWYTEPIVSRVMRTADKSAFEVQLAAINRFEAMLAQEGALVIKFWFHLSKTGQRARLKALERDPATRWRVTEADWQHFKRYDRFRSVSEHALRRTSTGHAPWWVVDGHDERFRAAMVGQALRKALRQRLRHDGHGARMPLLTAPLPDVQGTRTVLDAGTPGERLPREDYERQLEHWQGRLNLLLRQPAFASRSLVIVFEGMDAAGKGGAIRRITAALDARQYRVIPIAAPSDEERAQPYLWRFWRHVPRHGQVAIFDRSWYGRVLVERVEGFAEEADWMRGYAEINDFEDQLIEGGALVFKFWLSISPDEQLRRFKERSRTRFKRFKITPDDWRNRERWPDYKKAVCDMFDRTSTEAAPWTLIPADDKHHARIRVLETLCNGIRAALKQS